MRVGVAVKFRNGSGLNGIHGDQPDCSEQNVVIGVKRENQEFVCF